MLEREFYVITFDSTHKAISTEKKILNKVEFNMIPTPREISASCGLSIKFKLEVVDQILNLLKDHDKQGLTLYKVIRADEKKIADKIEWR